MPPMSAHEGFKDKEAQEQNRWRRHEKHWGQTEKKNTSETLEGRSATFRAQGSVFF